VKIFASFQVPDPAGVRSPLSPVFLSLRYALTFTVYNVEVPIQT